MNRRSFVALASGLLVPGPRRVYSFLWDNPLVRSVSLAEETLVGVDELVDQGSNRIIETTWLFASGRKFTFTGTLERFQSQL